MVVVLFNSMNVGFSTGIHILYWSRPSIQSTISQIANIGPLIGVLFINCFNSFFIVRRTDFFAHNSKMFKKDIMSKTQPIILWVLRFVTGLTIGLGNYVSYGLFIVLGIQIVYLAYMIFKRPYKKTIVSIGAIINESIICFILAIALVYNFYITNQMIAEDQWGSFMNIPVWVEVIFIILSLLMNTACVLYSVYKVICKHRTS
jgi:hypothetical protein